MHSKTIILLILSLFAISYAQFPSGLRDATCRKRSCAKNLEICGSNVTGAIIGCRADSECSGSGTTNGICIPPSRLGQPCVAQSECEDKVDCNNGYCSLQAPSVQFRNPGEKCGSDTDCYFNDPVNIQTQGICNSGKCRYIRNGQYCDSQDGQCQFDKSYCGRTNRCEKLIKKGGACNFGDSSQYGCGRKSMCIRNAPGENAGTCQEQYSVREGGYCFGSNYCDEGLYCGPANRDTGDRVCTKVKSSPTLGKPCFVYSSNSSDTCTPLNGESCGCAGDNDMMVCRASVPPKNYFNAQWDVNECQRKHCPNGAYNCIRDKCSKQMCKLYKMQKKASGRDAFDCSSETFCNSSFSLSPLSSLSSIVVALVAVVAVFMF